MTYHHGDLRRALLRAAAEAITENGVATLSMRDLARRAGVSHAAPTHHFGDKAGLLTAFATEGFDLLAKALATSRLASNSFLELGVTYVRFAVTRRAQFEVMFRTDLYHADDPEVLAARRRAADALYSAVSDLPDGTLAPAPAPHASQAAAAAPAQPIAAGPARSGVAGSAQSGVAGSAQSGVAGSAQSGVAGSAQSAVAGSAQSGVAGSAQWSVASSAPSGVAGSAQSGVAGSAPSGVAGSAQPDAAGPDQPRPAAARPARPGAADVASADVRAAGLAAWSMAHGFATLWLSGAFPDRDQDPTETARLIFTELNRDAAPARNRPARSGITPEQTSRPGPHDRH